MPKSYSYTVNTAMDIKKYSKHTLSKYAYVIMAQPVQDQANSFCLCVFGTDNKFTANLVLQRWSHTIHMLEEEEIRVLGISSDGDSRLLRAMRIKNNLPIINSINSFIPLSWREWFNSGFLPQTICIQDNIHIGNKLKNAFLSCKVLVIGNRVANKNHLGILIDKITKDQHLLTSQDIDGKDKMNYKSVDKIIDIRVEQCLKKYIPASEGTIFFLKLIRYVIMSFTEPGISATRRIYLIWFVVFSLRLWRKWISKSQYNALDNFITYNAFACIELNAHNIINLVVMLRSENKPEMFIPTLFQSQTCEKYFRQARSMTSTYSTVINFSLLELIKKSQRIQLIEEITNDLNQKNIKFPRSEKCKVTDVSELPDDETIEVVIHQAKFDAEEELSVFGISIDGPLDNCLEFIKKHETEDIADESEESCSEDVDNYENNTENVELLDSDLDSELNVEADCEHLITDINLILSNCNGELFLRNFSECETPIRNLVCLKYSSGKISYIKKSTMCWLFSNHGDKISTDRLRRFLLNKGCKLNRPLASCISQKEIYIGDWTIFHNEKSLITIGHVISFSYLRGSRRQREYTLASAPVKTPENTEPKGLGILCNWFNFNSQGSLEIAEHNSFEYIKIELYISHINPPKFDGEELMLNNNTMEYIKRFI